MKKICFEIVFVEKVPAAGVAGGRGVLELSAQRETVRHLAHVLELEIGLFLFKNERI